METVHLFSSPIIRWQVHFLRLCWVEAAVYSPRCSQWCIPDPFTAAMYRCPVMKAVHSCLLSYGQARYGQAQYKSKLDPGTVRDVLKQTQITERKAILCLWCNFPHWALSWNHRVEVCRSFSASVIFRTQWSIFSPPKCRVILPLDTQWEKMVLLSAAWGRTALIHCASCWKSNVITPAINEKHYTLYIHLRYCFMHNFLWCKLGLICFSSCSHSLLRETLVRH